MSRLNPLGSWRYANQSLPVVTDWCLFSCVVRVIWGFVSSFARLTYCGSRSLRLDATFRGRYPIPMPHTIGLVWGKGAHGTSYSHKWAFALVTQRRLTADFDNNRSVVWETDLFLYRVKGRVTLALSAWTRHGRISSKNLVVQKLSVPRMHENVQKTHFVSIYSAPLYRLRVLPVVLVE